MKYEQMSHTRYLEDHKVNGLEELNIRVLDMPSHGNACHEYLVEHPDFTCKIQFQKGPIREHGTNGLTQEVLLAILIDRLRGFQEGDFKCKENACALTHLEEAMMWLQQRTIKRLRRGVEGTNQK